MIKIEHTDVYGWEAAIRGMRNPMNSWDKSDSGICGKLHGYQIVTGEYIPCDCVDPEGCMVSDCEQYIIGQNDLKLMKNLSKAGDDHGKVIRYIDVTVDITAPLYFWKEWDTYKVGTVANSCSTMHKIHAKEFTLDDFSHEHLIVDWVDDNVESFVFGEIDEPYSPKDVLEFTIESLNVNRKKYIETKDKKYWWQMIQLLPSSYNQKRTIKLNYQVLKHMYHARKHHKLDEWRAFCDWCESLPYFKEICIDV